MNIESNDFLYLSDPGCGELLARVEHIVGRDHMQIKILAYSNSENDAMQVTETHEKDESYIIPISRYHIIKRYTSPIEMMSDHGTLFI